MTIQCRDFDAVVVFSLVGFASKYSSRTTSNFACGLAIPDSGVQITGPFIRVGFQDILITPAMASEPY